MKNAHRNYSRAQVEFKYFFHIAKYIPEIKDITMSVFYTVCSPLDLVMMVAACLSSPPFFKAVYLWLQYLTTPKKNMGNL